MEDLHATLSKRIARSIDYAQPETSRHGFTANAGLTVGKKFIE
jgi:hypothetical protein